MVKCASLWETAGIPRGEEVEQSQHLERYLSMLLCRGKNRFNWLNKLTSQGNPLHNDF